MQQLNSRVVKSPRFIHKSWVSRYVDCLQLHHPCGHADHIACKLTNRWKFACPARRNACVKGCVTGENCIKVYGGMSQIFTPSPATDAVAWLVAGSGRLDRVRLWCQCGSWLSPVCGPMQTPIHIENHLFSKLLTWMHLFHFGAWYPFLQAVRLRMLCHTWLLHLLHLHLLLNNL